MLGPTGVGVLYGRSELLNALPPFLTGGSMITTVTMERPSTCPHRSVSRRARSGSRRRSRSRAAVDYLERDRHATASRSTRRASASCWWPGSTRSPASRVLGPRSGEPRVGLASFDVAGVHSHDVGQFLDDRGIAVRVGPPLRAAAASSARRHVVHAGKHLPLHDRRMRSPSFSTGSPPRRRSSGSRDEFGDGVALPGGHPRPRLGIRTATVSRATRPRIAPGQPDLR